MKLLTVNHRITLGLISLLASTILVAVFSGFGPDARHATMQGRAALCESIAINASILLSRQDLKRMDTILTAIVARNHDILSAGIRRADGSMHLEIGDHAQWNPATRYSTESHVQVPLHSGDGLWGTVELRFRPLRQPGLMAALRSPWSKHVALVCGVCFVLFSIYLGKVLKQLDPSKAIPKRVRTALDTLAEGLLVTDKRGRVVLANEAFARWTGKAADDLIGYDADAFDWAPAHESIVDDFHPWTRALEESTAQSNLMLRLTDKNQRMLTLVANASPVLGHDGVYRGVLTSFEDVTELEQHKVELSNAKDAADAANQAKSDFLARMSHEIRTPMNAILGYTELLQRRMAHSEPQRQEFLKIIQGSGEHLLTLINDILDLSKIESGRMDLELARYSPAELISQAVSIFQLKAEEKGISLTLEHATPLPETILTDAVRLRQIIINLVGNAIKFTERGSVRVVVGMLPASKPTLKIDVIDTGIGIAPGAMDRIFDPFSQEDTSITRRFGGTGLGLAICRFLAEKMGGAVTATSQSGHGSTFSITVDPGPLDRVKMVPAGEPRQAQASSDEDAQFRRLPPARILVVDDAQANRELADLFLKRAGANVMQAENGQIALEMVQAQTFDLILMDVHMPVMDGLTATRQLRASGYTMPIVALTGNALEDDRSTCKAAGFTGFLAKPIRMSSLLDTVAQALTGASNWAAEGDLPKTMARSEPQAVGHSPQPPAAQAVTETALCEQVHESVNRLRGELRGRCDASQDTAPIHSSLPTDDPELHEIVTAFVERLKSQTMAMEQALQAEKFKELEELAHWLKGAGGSLGFDQFTAPARLLESCAKSGDQAGMARELRLIVQLVARVQPPAAVAIA